MSDLTPLIDRIKSRPARELESTLKELSALIPVVDGEPIIRLEERHRDVDGLGDCLFVVLKIQDPLVGEIEHYLHVFEFDKTTVHPLTETELHRFVEATDQDGQPLFPIEDAKRAVLECLSSFQNPPANLPEGNKATADEWVPIESVGHFILERNRVGEHAKGPSVKRRQTNEPTAKQPRYQYYVLRSKLNDYIKKSHLPRYVQAAEHGR